MFFKKENKKSEYDIYLDKLLNLIRKKGILVKVMPKDTTYYSPDMHQEYKKYLGVIPLEDKHGNITNVYQVYEDFDGSIKYYDYPMSTQKEIKKMRKKYKKNIYNILVMGTSQTGTSKYIDTDKKLNQTKL